MLRYISNQILNRQNYADGQIKINSEFGKKSQLYLNSIIKYNEISEEIHYENTLEGIDSDEENPFMIPIPGNLNSENIIDSLCD